MTARNLSATPRSRSWLAAGLSALVAALGFTVLVGWHTHSPRMTQSPTGKTPLVYNTAIGFVVLGAALPALSLGRRRLSAAVDHQTARHLLVAGEPATSPAGIRRSHSR
jgi:hypothetical protein